MDTIEIDIWSDIACPWCWIGKRSLDAALVGLEHAVTLRWRAFELNPEAPRTAPLQVDYVARLADKYAVSRAEAEGFVERMVGAGRDRGIEIRFDRIRPGNTFDAHRLLAHARTKGMQTALKERLFSAYLSEGRAICELDTLRELASDIGLDSDGVATLLLSDDHADEVRADQALAQRLGINGVPCFVFPQLQQGLSGAQPPDVLRAAIERAASQVDSKSGGASGPA